MIWKDGEKYGHIAITLEEVNNEWEFSLENVRTNIKFGNLGPILDNA